MIDVSGLKLSLDAGLPAHHDRACAEIAHQLGIKPVAIERAQLMKRSVDARKKSNIHFTATYRLWLASSFETQLLARAERGDSRLKGLQIREAKPYKPLELAQLSAPEHPPVVVGAGPAGLFAAWYLAKCGLTPILVEQGAPVEERTRDVQRFFQEGVLDPWSNIQFGEGGAGTFSDGKLTTNIKNRYTAHVLHWFVDAGAPESILWQAHPHMGSDNLAHIVSSIRKDIIRFGGEVRFHTHLSDITLEEGRVHVVTLENVLSGAIDALACETLILACGHSARQTFELVRDRGFAMEQKPFSMGVRIEHPQALINEAQWGSAAHHPALGAAEYKLAIHLPGGRNVYSFCMCPGGEVVAAASEAGGVVTNGMSNYARDGRNANAALLVNVDPSDLASDEVLAGVELQRSVEQCAYQVAQRAGGSAYQAPAQTVGSFLGNAQSEDAPSALRGGLVDPSAAVLDTDDKARVSCVPTYERGVVASSLDEVLPDFVTSALKEALPLMGKKIRGFDDPGAVLTAPETRSSSPVRLCRDETLQAYLVSNPGKSAHEHSADGPAEDARPATGLYPCGEGPGFAGGIMSAAADGLKVAAEVVRSYQVAEVVDALKAGQPALFPTDTVYGLGVAVEAAPSPACLYQLKCRSDDKPIAWLVEGEESLTRYGKNVPSWAYKLAQTYWPGALTLVVDASDEVPEAYRSQANTIALRMPDHSLALSLIKAVGPLATTSANLSGDPAPACWTEVPDEFTSAVRAIVGEVRVGQASSVIDCTGSEPCIIRSGAIDPSEFTTNDLFHADRSS